MNAKTLLSLVLFATVLTSASRTAHAAVMSRDWKTPGDGLLTYDDVNQREWLDVPETLLSKFGSFENVVSQTNPGDVFDGFMPATGDDVFALAVSAGIEVNSLSFTVNGQPTRRLIDFLGATLGPSQGNATSLGLLNDFNEPSSPAPGQLAANILAAEQVGKAGIQVIPVSSISLDPPLVFNSIGVMLYRGVPEPSSWVLAILAAAPFACKLR